MSCPVKNRSKSEKPKKTKVMSEKGLEYVWKEVSGNPNMYCWLPISAKYANPSDLNFEDVNLQDIPPPKVPTDFKEILEDVAKEAEYTRQKELAKDAKKFKKLKNLVSTDDIHKYPIVKDFIKEKGLKIYGGVAINAYLPREEKIYGSREIPDYDFYSPDPWNDAVELGDIFHEKGFDIVEVRAGIHKGTYKVLVNLWPVADITYMPISEFRKIETKTINGLRVVSPVKLLENLYKEYAEPYSYPARWPKIALREKLLQKWVNPLGKKFKCSKHLFSGGDVKVRLELANLLEITYTFIKKNKMVFGGALAYNTLIEVGGGSKRLVVDNYRVYSENAQSDIQKLMTELMKKYKKLDIHTQYLPSKEINNTIYRIYADIEDETYLVCEMIQLTTCSPYVRVMNRDILSVDYRKYGLYDNAVHTPTKQERKDAKCKIQYLTKIQDRYYTDMNITELDKSPFQRFVITCIGPVENRLKVEILNRWLNRKQENTEIIKTGTPTHRIRKIPRVEIPERCDGLSEKSCRYPCAWNKFTDKCTGIPKGIYRPEEKDLDMINEYV